MTWSRASIHSEVSCGFRSVWRSSFVLSIFSIQLEQRSKFFDTFPAPSAQRYSGYCMAQLGAQQCLTVRPGAGAQAFHTGLLNNYLLSLAFRRYVRQSKRFSENTHS